MATSSPSGRRWRGAEPVTARSMFESPARNDDAGTPTRFSRQMTLSREEFLRTLPAAVGRMPCTIEGDLLRLDDGKRCVTFRLSDVEPRRIGALSLPALNVEFLFIGYTKAQRQAFMDRFERYFQRGGG